MLLYTLVLNTLMFPVFVLGTGPMQSNNICVNGSPIAGMGCSGAGGMVWFGLPAL